MDCGKIEDFYFLHVELNTRVCVCAFQGVRTVMKPPTWPRLSPATGNLVRDNISSTVNVPNIQNN